MFWVQLFSKISQSGCFWKYPSKQKHVQSLRLKNVNVNVIRVFWLAYKIFLKSVTATVFDKTSSLLHKWQWRSLLLPSNCDGVCFSKDLDFYYKCQWLSLWHGLILSPCCGSLVLVKLQVFTICGSDGICDGACFYLHAVIPCL